MALTCRILHPVTIANVAACVGQAVLEVYRVPGSATSTYQAVAADGLGYEMPKALDRPAWRCPSRDRKVAVSA